MLDFILNYFELSEVERKDIKEEIEKIGLNSFYDIYLTVCAYRNENIFDHYEAIENYLTAN